MLNKNKNLIPLPRCEMSSQQLRPSSSPALYSDNNKSFSPSVNSQMLSKINLIKQELIFFLGSKMKYSNNSRNSLVIKVLLIHHSSSPIHSVFKVQALGTFFNRHHLLNPRSNHYFSPPIVLMCFFKS